MSLMIKDPDSRIDYAFDWSAAYLDGQVLTASQWAVTPAHYGGVVVAASAFDAVRSSATLAGGITGNAYRISNRVTLSDGQIDERSIVLRVEQR